MGRFSVGDRVMIYNDPNNISKIVDVTIEKSGKLIFKVEKKGSFYQEDLRLVSENDPDIQPEGNIQTVAVQGLGFVGAAMAVAVANASDNQGNPLFQVMGVDLPTATGRERVKKINSAHFPFESGDKKIIDGIQNAVSRGNLTATTDDKVFRNADIILVSVNMDISSINGRKTIQFEAFQNAIYTLGKNIKQGVLLIIETTVPPGTCEKIVQPIIHEQAKKRGIDTDSIHIAHSYERVMPGENYLDSIINFWRVYSGLTVEAADKCEAFLSRIINVKEYPLVRLNSTIASETAKVLENSYRAVNIAFIEEWGRFAEEVGIDLYEVIDAIRVRPTHSNIRHPGFGVGGYCLTKDPLFAMISAREIFNLNGHNFPFSTQALEINQNMPLVTFNKLKKHFNGKIKGKKILLMGISYREDVGDTRFSPAEVFFEHARKEGAQVFPHDPLVEYWEEIQLKINRNLPDANGFDAIVFSVPHRVYRDINFDIWLKNNRECLIFDANNVLTNEQRQAIKELDNKYISIGRG